MQSYLQPEELKKLDLQFFDNWASNFGEVVSSLELAPSGQSFRVKERFAKFTNLPELMGLYRQVADIQTAEMLNLNVPKIKDGKPITISVEPSDAQKKFVDYLVDMCEQIRRGEIKPEDYNMLCVTNDGRLCALDMRCLNSSAEDFEGSKVNICVEKVFEIYKESDEKKLTQMVFSDVSTPNTSNKENKFTVYSDIKEKLIIKGVKPEEIAFVHDAKTDEAKEKLFSKMRSGEIRVLIGSTSKMGAGTNCQTKLVALHHLDCPWRPSDLEQRNGRIVRQGNENPEVQLYQYVTKGTLVLY